VVRGPVVAGGLFASVVGVDHFGFGVSWPVVARVGQVVRRPATGVGSAVDKRVSAYRLGLAANPQLIVAFLTVIRCSVDGLISCSRDTTITGRSMIRGVSRAVCDGSAPLLTIKRRLAVFSLPRMGLGGNMIFSR
jgi:hypothetical protein